MYDNISFITRFLTHLKKKGFSGGINIDFNEKTLSVEVSNLLQGKMYHNFLLGSIC